MSQARRGFAYDQLHDMSFIQLFHLLVAIANRYWLTNPERAAEAERWHPPVPVMVAGFRYNGGEALQQRSGHSGAELRERNEVW